jgi:hypothetical protein
VLPALVVAYGQGETFLQAVAAQYESFTVLNHWLERFLCYLVSTQKAFSSVPATFRGDLGGGNVI